MEWVESACDEGASQVRACEIVGLSVRTLQRWKLQGDDCCDGRSSAQRPVPGNRLTGAERQRILEVCNSDRFQSLPPSQIVPALLDEGVYIGSVSSIYRVLKAAGQQHHRGRQQKPVKRQPATHKATAPNQLWSWDISWLNSPVRGHYYYLYLVWISTVA
jgi:transposase